MVITVHCPACSASFPVDSNKIPAAGVNARCSACAHVFRVERPVEEQAPPAPPEPEPLPQLPEPEAEHLPAFEAEAEPEPLPTFEAEAEPEPLPAFETEAAFDPWGEAAGGGTGEEPGGSWRDTWSGEPDFQVGTEVPEPPAPTEDWVFERDDGLDATGLDIQPLETAGEPPAAVAPEPAWEPEPPAAPEPTPPPVEPPPAAPAPSVGSFAFGKRDPKDKARRLARVLVSDMIMYNQDRHQRALAAGTLKEDFEDEITKSWKEYVDQVGEEMATQNPFWTDALNDVLAKGEKIF
jgi:predicted Zn finger-like uncharacterized protein